MDSMQQEMSRLPEAGQCSIERGLGWVGKGNKAGKMER
jgi:hypothetical protein